MLNPPITLNLLSEGVAALAEEEGRVRLTTEDLKELWGASLLNDTAYLALVLLHVRQEMLAKGNLPSPNALLLDVNSFINEYGRWDGLTPGGKEVSKRLYPRHLLVALSKLQEKHWWVMENIPHQLSLSFIGG